MIFFNRTLPFPINVNVIISFQKRAENKEKLNNEQKNVLLSLLVIQDKKKNKKNKEEEQLTLGQLGEGRDHCRLGSEFLYAVLSQRLPQLFALLLAQPQQ